MRASDVRNAMAALVLVAGAAAGDDDFADVTRERGIDFTSVNGATGERFLVETMLAGAAWIDADADGFLDLYLVQGHSRPQDALAGPGPANGPANVLYRNVGGRRFEKVPDAGGAADRGYGMGVATGDSDGDGFPDLYVTNYGRNALYRNRGDGTFEDVTAAAGVGAPAAAGGRPVWSTSATWADFDGDGRLDLYVVNYLAYDTRRDAACSGRLPGSGRSVPSYCHPNRFAGVPDTLYRNAGGGRFVDVSAAAGISRIGGLAEAKGLGVAASDFDNDGDLDILVANDTVSNTLWRNLGGFRFEEVGLETGFALSGDGSPQAGMGIARGDVDGNGFLDYLVTNFSRETNTLYLGDGGLFTDGTARCGLARASYLPLGFGARFLDHDGDGDLDLYVANGHILDNAEELHPGEGIAYRQPDRLFENTGRGRFRDRSREAGAWFRRALAGRCVIEGDYDNDGDGDLLVTNVAGPAVLLENRRDRGVRWVGIDPGWGLAAHGSRIEARIGSRTIIHEIQTDGGYLGAHDPRVRLALPEGGNGLAGAEVRLRLPGRWDAPRVLEGLAAGRYNRVR